MPVIAICMFHRPIEYTTVVEENISADGEELHEDTEEACICVYVCTMHVFSDHIATSGTSEQSSTSDNNNHSMQLLVFP